MTAHIGTIPPGCVPRFVGEGAANIVFEIVSPGRGSDDAVFKGKLGNPT